MDSPDSSFDIDAILNEFNLGKEPPQPISVQQDNESAVARVRESLGLGRSLFRRKQSSPADIGHGHIPVVPLQMDGLVSDNEYMLAEKPFKPRKRIIETDDEDDTDSSPRPGSPVRSSSPPTSVNETTILNNQDNVYSDDDVLTTDAIVADFRKARLEALSAKIAAKTLPETEDPIQAVSERSSSRSRSTTPTERKHKLRKAGKKALEEMNRETQRMARNMALRPEVRPAKKVDINSVFAKFGFNPQQSVAAEHSEKESEFKETTREPIPNSLPESIVQDPPEADVRIPLIIRHSTPTFESDSDESLLSPSKIFSNVVPQTRKPLTHPQRKLQFTLQPADSDSDSDVEILPPRPALNHLSTPDRKYLKRTALIKALANVKSPLQTRSPNRLTARELDETLTREAALQAATKREQRRAELKALGIDVQRVVKKRDLLEEAREEAKRVREEEGGEESDEEYIDEDNDADIDDDLGPDDDDGTDQEMGDESEDEDQLFDGEASTDEEKAENSPATANSKRKRRGQILSDDEEVSVAVVPETPDRALPPVIPKLSDLEVASNPSLSQFFEPTQLSGSTDSSTSMAHFQPNQTTQLTQFFTSTAVGEDKFPQSAENGAHSAMDLLRRNAAVAFDSLRDENIGFSSSEPQVEDRPLQPILSPVHPTASSPAPRRVLKRKSHKGTSFVHLTQEDSEEFKRNRHELIEEQAEESEDDYKVWGSGDESENENMNRVVEGLIDDETKVSKDAERDAARLFMYILSDNQSAHE
jgi:MRC1-like domain